MDKKCKVFLRSTLLKVTLDLGMALAVLTLGAGPALAAGGEDGLTESQLELYATSAVLMDGESGRILYGKNATEPMANASTTKILTCMLVLEQCDLTEMASVSAYAASMPKVKLYVKKGEQYQVKDLLYSLMLESHNDVAVVLAEHVGKEWVAQLKGRSAEEFSEEESKAAVKAFAMRMNEKAKEIGCNDTYFITPNGLDATESITLPDGTEETVEHHTTARDLALILSYCILRSPHKEEFLEITRANSHSFSANGRSFACYNHNAFLSMMEGALSGKTGFTGKAGYCYVGALQRDGRTYVVALLACGWPNNRSYKWKDARKLMEYGIKGFSRVNLYQSDVLFPENELPSIPVREGRWESIGVNALVGTSVPVRMQYQGERGILLGQNEKISVKVILPEEVEAPIAKGQTLGEIQYLIGKVPCFRELVVADREIPRIDFLWCFRKVFLFFCRGESN